MKHIRKEDEESKSITLAFGNDIYMCVLIFMAQYAYCKNQIPLTSSSVSNINELCDNRSLDG